LSLRIYRPAYAVVLFDRTMDDLRPTEILQVQRSPLKAYPTIGCKSINLYLTLVGKKYKGLILSTNGYGGDKDMGKNVSFTIKLPIEQHTKLKVLSALTGKTMTDLVGEWIEKQNVKYDGSIDKPVKPEAVLIDKSKAVSVDRDKIIKKIMALDKEGTKAFSIAKIFNEEGIPTFKGGKEWRESTVKGIIKREKAKQGASD